MTFLPFILCAVVYLIIGAFIAGVDGDDDMFLVYLLIWPLMGVVFFCVWFFSLIARAGELVRELFAKQITKLKKAIRK